MYTDINVTLKQQLERSMEIFMEKNLYLEVRILNTSKGTVSGYYNDVEKMYLHIKQYDGKYNLFFTMNQPKSGIEARSVNHLMQYAKNTTSDIEIERRRWILVDLDPVRPSGISSTDEELEKSFELSEAIEKFLSETGISQPVKALSGNGYHLLYPIDLPNDKESTALVQNFLKMLDVKFSKDAVKVDISNFNAARITKLYGTMACKGDSTTERPHRRSKILSCPDTLEPVMASLLQKVIQDNFEMLSPRNNLANHSHTKESKSTFCLEEWLTAHEILVAKKKPIDNGICYVLKECPWNQEHSKDFGAYINQYQDGNVTAGCHHASCKENKEDWKSLWKLYEGNKPLPRMMKKSNDVASVDKESQVDVLLQIVETEGHELFKNQFDDTFARVPSGKNFANYSIHSDLYYKLLVHRYYQTFKKSPRKDSIQQALETLSARASYEKNEYEVYKRFAMHKDSLYYYLADEDNTVLSINENGIAVCEEPPVRLIKRKSLLAQPMPVKGKDFVELMRKYYHFASKSDRILHNVLLVTRLVTNIEQPLVIYTGEKGSSKTTSMEMVKRCLDFSSNNVTVMPKNEEDFLLLLNSQDIICLDNLDYISKTQADIFCQAVTGATAVKRKKYTDSELCEISIKSTIYMNGINLLSNRSDFLDRCIFLNMKSLTAKSRRSKSEVMEEFEKDKPYILHGIFATLSAAMKKIDMEKIDMDDRLVDVLRWGCVVAEELGYEREGFLKAYKKNRTGINEELLANDEVAHAVLDYLECKGNFEGTMTDMSIALSDLLQEEGLTVSNRIKSSMHLSKRLNELKTGLLDMGIEVEIGKKEGKRYVTIHKKEEDQYGNNRISL